VNLYGEKRQTERNNGTNPGDDNEGWMTAWDQDTFRWSDLSPLPDRKDAVATGEYRFGASHPATFNVVMCDGAVKSISYRIESRDDNVLPVNTGVPPAVVYTGNTSLFNLLGNRRDGFGTSNTGELVQVP
jgi:hypothetical protein